MIRNLRSFAKFSSVQYNGTVRVSRFYSRLYEPDYLCAMKAKYPTLPTVNIQLTGYDFPILENFQKYLHNYAEALNLDVSECWAAPPQQMQIQRFKLNSAVIDAEYKLQIFERNLQISNLQAPLYTLFLRIAQATLPEGVTLNVVEHTDDEVERRFVPDRDLLQLKAELDDMGGPISTKKK